MTIWQIIGHICWVLTTLVGMVCIVFLVYGFFRYLISEWRMPEKPKTPGLRIVVRSISQTPRPLRCICYECQAKRMQAGGRFNA